MDEKISKLFLPLLDKLYNTEPAGEPFRKPVDVIKYGCYDYYLYVKHPIDLSTIRQRLVEHQYKDAWRFVADVQLMFSNAYLFNKKGTPVWEFTNKLNKIWTSELTPIMQRLNYCCGTLHKFGPQLLFCCGTTPDRYCQIPIGAKYKCYQDQYSFCIPCFNKIETDYVNIQGLSCETTRMKLPTQPVKKSDFLDYANDRWQYESFIQCSQCSRRVHQICDIYPADEDEINACIQHDQVELEQKMLCRVPDENKGGRESQNDTIEAKQDNDSKSAIPNILPSQQIATPSGQLNSPTSLDDELLQFARDVEDSNLTNSTPASPKTIDTDKYRVESSKGNCQSKLNQAGSPREEFLSNIRTNSNNPNCSSLSNSKNSVDSIAARLSINKLTSEAQPDGEQPCKSNENNFPGRDRFQCNHCYRKKTGGYNMRHRKYSARRLPHTRMSRYIENEVNDHIRENSPSAGEVTIRVLTAYRDTAPVKPEMNEYIKKCRQKDTSQRHPNACDYPNEFGYTNRAIFAWQEIDCVDVCVFGMHVQEYGEDCPEPNKLVVYLSYLDSVHFFRPKQARTAVYHEILLSYFKYVKKLGFRRVFIWVCPSRKGDDYIFYRHPTEQKMPTLKRLSDWYINLLDKGVMAGIVERHQNIYQYVATQNCKSILDMPYLSGDYWPGEFERLLKSMIEYEKDYENKLRQGMKDDDLKKSMNISDLGEHSAIEDTCFNSSLDDSSSERHNILSLSSLYQNRAHNSGNGKSPSLRGSFMNSMNLKSNSGRYDRLDMFFNLDGDYNQSSYNEETFIDAFTPESYKSDHDQPLDLSKSSSNNSPESFYDEDIVLEMRNSSEKRKSTNNNQNRKKKRAGPQVPSSFSTRAYKNNSLIMSPHDLKRFASQPPRSTRQKSCTQQQKNLVGSEFSILSPEEELIKNLERSLKRQREGFIVARLNDCDCSPSFESQRRKEEPIITCDLMKGREPLLQLTRQKNYEFSSLRRAKFSSLAMVKHLSQTFKLEPICNECFSFDSSKRHYACSCCIDYYLCTSCHENTQHPHVMFMMAPTTLPDIEEFLLHCSLASATSSISSASSTISNKSFNDATIELSSTLSTPITKNSSYVSITTPLNRHLSNTVSSTMPLSCQRQRNRGSGSDSRMRFEDEENAEVCSFDSRTKLSLTDRSSPPPSHSSDISLGSNPSNLEIDQVLVDNFIRHAEVMYEVDFDQMRNESKKLLAHYWSCPAKETCHRCKFVILSCSFMSTLMKSTRMQMMINCNPSEILPTNISNSNHLGGINLTTARQFSYQPKDK